MPKESLSIVDFYLKKQNLEKFIKQEDYKGAADILEESGKDLRDWINKYEIENKVIQFVKDYDRLDKILYREQKLELFEIVKNYNSIDINGYPKEYDIHVETQYEQHCNEEIERKRLKYLDEYVEAKYIKNSDIEKAYSASYSQEEYNKSFEDYIYSKSYKEYTQNKYDKSHPQVSKEAIEQHEEAIKNLQEREKSDLENVDRVQKSRKLSVGSNSDSEEQFKKDEINKVKALIKEQREKIRRDHPIVKRQKDRESFIKKNELELKSNYEKEFAGKEEDLKRKYTAEFQKFYKNNFTNSFKQKLSNNLKNDKELKYKLRKQYEVEYEKLPKEVYKLEIKKLEDLQNTQQEEDNYKKNYKLDLEKGFKREVFNSEYKVKHFNDSELNTILDIANKSKSNLKEEKSVFSQIVDACIEAFKKVKNKVQDKSINIEIRIAKIDIPQEIQDQLKAVLRESKSKESKDRKDSLIKEYENNNKGINSKKSRGK